MASPTQKHKRSLAESEALLPIAREVMLAKMYGRDEMADGQFITGVLTTGVYCLPSCSARKPLAGNVVFFADHKGARNAGLRACLRCRPDAFYNNHDPDRDAFERALGWLRSDPGRFSDVSDFAAAVGYGVGKVNRLSLRNHGMSVGALVIKTRVEAAAKQLNSTDDGILEVAHAVGFRAISSFYVHFKRITCVTPGQHRQTSRRTT